MKTKRIIPILAILCAMQIALAGVANAFTPDRQVLEVQDGDPGLTYNSYNNYTYGAVDERTFTWFTVNEDWENFAKTWEGNFKDGDIVTFRDFFHNNGEDPYDGSGTNPVPGSSDARSTYVGVDISNPNSPKGFIYSPDNEYRTKKPSGGYDTIKYKAGDYIFEQGGEIGDMARTASDSVALNSNDPISLELDITGAIVSMEYDLDGDGKMETNEKFVDYKWVKPGQPITAKIPVESTAINGTSGAGTKNLTITLGTDANKQKAWIKFDKHPGCFRYAGRVYFTATVHKEEPLPTYCSSLTLTKQTQQTCNPNTKFTVFTAKVNFTDENVPTEQYIVFDSTDKKAKLTLYPPNQGTITEFPSKPQKVIGKFIAGAYDGIGTIKATYTDAQGKPIEGLVKEEATGEVWPGSCTGSIPTCTDDCVDICVQRPVDIPAGSLSEFSAEATGYYGDTWSGQIQYLAEKGKGKFYTGKKSDVIAQIQKDFPGAKPYDNTSATLSCENLTNIMITPQNILNLITNTFSTENSFNVNISTTGIPPQYNFIKPIDTAPEQFYEIPENLKIKKPPTGGDPNPIDTKKFMNSILMALDFKTYNPKSQDIDVKTGLDISTSTGGQDLEIADQEDLKGSLDLNDLDIDVSQDYATPDVADIPKGTFTPLSNNDEPLLSDYESAVTAAENESVWFYAAEEGDDSIVVRAADTLNPDCSQEFDISAPPACQSMSVGVLKKDHSSVLYCIPEGEEVILGANSIALSNGKKADYNLDKIKTLWSATDTKGKFLEFPANAAPLPKEGKNSIETEKLGVTYTGKGPISCKITSINSFAEPANTPCAYTIPACPKVIEKCGKLDLKFNETPVKPTTSDKITTIEKTKEEKGAEMTLAVASDKNADYPSYVIWEDETEGELTFKNPQHVQKLPDSFMTKVVNGVETVITIKNYSAKYPEAGMPTLKNAKHEGAVTAEVQGEELICSATLNVIKVEEIKVENVCQVLTPQVQTMGSSEWTKVSGPIVLPTTNNYLIQNTITYSPDIDESLKLVDYRTDKGYLAKAVKVSEQPGAENLPQWIIDTLGDLPLPAGNTVWAGVTELKGVPAGKQVIFVPGKNLKPGMTYTKGIEIVASGSDPVKEPDCIKYISLFVPTSKEACQNIALHAEPSWWPLQTQNFSSEKGTKFWLTGDTGDYTGNFIFKLIPEFPYYNYISLNGKIDLKIEKFIKELEVTKKDAFENGVYAFGLDPYTSWTMTVIASEEGQKCESGLEYTPPPPPAKETECQSLTITKPTSWTLGSGKEELFEVKVEPAGYAWKVKWSTTNGSFDSSTTYGDNKNTLKTFSSGTSVTAKVEEDGTLKDKDGNCSQSMTVKTPESHEDTEPTIKKRVIKEDLDDAMDASPSDWENIVNLSGRPIPPKDKFVTYKIEFEPGTGDSEGKSVLIQDKDLDDGEIKGSEGGKLILGDFDNMKIFIDKSEADICEYEEKNGNLKLHSTSPCVTTEDQDEDEEDLFEAFGAGEDGGLVFNNIDKDVNKIKIFYEMKNDTALTQEKCATMIAENGCGELFTNEARFETYSENDLDGKDLDDDDTNPTKVIAVCPYVLTRASGDVFFETVLNTGIDVAYCSKQKNIQAPIITPIEAPEEAPLASSGTRTVITLTLPSHDICKYSNVTQKQAEESNKEQNPEGYQNPFKNFSSTICEMKAEVAENWMKKNVVNQISTNVEKISLWSLEQTSEKISQTPMASINGIFKWAKDLTIDGGTQYAISGGDITRLSTQAAQTYIIKDANLYINSNIVYDKTQTPWDLKSYPSAAFIVINGNIIIDKDVERLDGTYIAIDVDGTGKGKVLSTDVSYSQLTINGSLIGDVSNLFENRKYVGNVAADEGSVTIKYNENFLLNPPPGLNQLMDIKQLEVAY